MPRTISSAARTASASTYRPKAQRFRTLTLLWVFPSAGALLILGMNWGTWSRAASLPAALAATRVEQWTAQLLLLLHAAFFLLARHYRRTEEPIEVPPE